MTRSQHLILQCVDARIPSITIQIHFGFTSTPTWIASLIHSSLSWRTSKDKNRLCQCTQVVKKNFLKYIIQDLSSDILFVADRPRKSHSQHLTVKGDQVIRWPGKGSQQGCKKKHRGKSWWWCALLQHFFKVVKLGNSSKRRIERERPVKDTPIPFP